MTQPKLTSDKQFKPSILYIGPDSGTCRARRLALERIGCDVTAVDPFAALPGSWARTWSFKTGSFGLTGLVRRFIIHMTGGRTYDLAYVDGGELLDGVSVGALRMIAKVVVNYNPDNPYEKRDGARWRAFLASIGQYDCLFVPRAGNVDQAVSAGARQVHRVWFAADEQLKDPAYPSEADKAPYRSVLTFVGTWMPERGPFMADIIRAGLPIRILGPRWNRAPEFPLLAPYTRLGMLNGTEYDAAVAASGISIGLLSKGNRDEHTTRSIEIPALGSVLCGERTAEHQLLYDEGVEATFWEDASECIEQCLTLIADPDRRARISAAGRSRAIYNDLFNEPLMRQIVQISIAMISQK